MSSIDYSKPNFIELDMDYFLLDDFEDQEKLLRRGADPYRKDTDEVFKNTFSKILKKE